MAGITGEDSPGGLFGGGSGDATTTATAEQSQIAAAASETAAAASATTATTKASEASTSATNAASSATTASGHATTATTKASEASSSASTASGHATTATTKASEAATSASTATTKASEAATSATNAASSASTATTKASEAATSATSASTSASTATTQATTATTQATTATTKASEAATSATNAASSASTASGHKDTATTKASEAATSATNAATSASTASTQATNAATSATSASNSASTATTKATTATTQATTATTKASEASTSATNAASSATAAASSATAAASSATAAAGSATTASGHKDTATTKASEAATSATNAANSATTASTQATNSSNSASTASTQATTATNKAADAGKYAVHAEDSQFTLSDGSTTGYSALHWNAKAEDQKTAAATSATNAASSATAAASSATSAAGSATTATTQATNASNSATTATTQANTATTQASTATTKASEAATSATNAATSASTASTQATNSSNSASSSATAQAASEAARDAALAALDSFDDRYLGVKSSGPSVDNDGNALAQGALYFDSSTDSMKVYDGSSWLNAYASLSGALIASNNLSDLNNAGTARTNLGVAIGSNVQAHSSVLDGTQQSFTTALKNKLDGVATSANAYVHPNHSGEVTSSADGATVIADNIVDEANLKVSNTPTNGYFLSAQSGNSGGLTWAVPTDTQYSVGDGGLTQNNFTDADHSKLNGIEASATADQTDAEIRAAVEAATDSNVFTDADHTKLNGIEASATADQTAAEIRTLVESASDSNVFTDADHSKLDAIEASADVTDATNVTAAGALMDSEVTNLAQVKAFASSDYATAAQGTTANAALPKAGGTMTGAIEMGSNAITSAGNLSLDVAGYVDIDADDGGVYFTDGGTTFGRIYNSSSNLRIKSQIGDKDISFEGVDGSSAITALTLDMSDGGTATFAHDIKFADHGQAIFGGDGDFYMGYYGSSTGSKISATNGPFTIDASGDITLDAGGSDISLQSGAAEYGKFNLTSNSLNIHSSISDGDIVFKGNDGGSAITAMTIDMSEGGRVGVGLSSSIDRKLHVQNDNDYAAKFGGTGAGDYAIEIGQTGTNGSAGLNATGSGGSMKFSIAGSEVGRFSSGGNLGINQNSPSQKLHVGGNAIITGLTRLGDGTESSPAYQFVNDTNTGMYSSASDALGFSTGGTNRLTLNSTGATFSSGIVAPRIKSTQATVAANSSSTALDFGATNNFMVNMTADTTFSFSNLSSSIGCSGNIILVQDATGGRDFTLPSEAKTPIDGATIVQNTGANEISVLSYYVMSSSQVLVNYIGDFA